MFCNPLPALQCHKAPASVVVLPQSRLLEERNKKCYLCTGQWPHFDVFQSQNANRHISTCPPLGILNPAHLSNPNWSQPKSQQKQILYAKILFLYRQPRVQRQGDICLSLQPPNEHPGFGSTGFLPPHHGHWGGSWITGRIFKLFYFSQAVKWWNILQWLVFGGSHWRCICPALCHHRWSGSV